MCEGKTAKTRRKDTCTEAKGEREWAWKSGPFSAWQTQKKNKSSGLAGGWTTGCGGRRGSKWETQRDRMILYGALSQVEHLNAPKVAGPRASFCFLEWVEPAKVQI